MAGLGRDPRDPGAHLRVASEIEASLARHMGIGVERHIGDGIARGREPVIGRQVPLHHRKGEIPPLGIGGQLRAARVARRGVMHEIAVHRDRGLVGILLEEHPLQCLCLGPGIFGEVARAAGEPIKQRPRFGHDAAIVELHRRHLADRRHGAVGG